MSDETKRYVCVPSTPGLRTLTFPDGCRVSVMGLTEIFDEVYAEGRQANRETADEIVHRLGKTNYIPSSARDEYRAVIEREYGSYVEIRSGRTGRDKGNP